MNKKEPSSPLVNLNEQALYYDYASTANPIFAGLIPPVPYHSFSPDFFEQKTSGILPLDVSEQMKCPGPATSPALLANFVRIVKGTLKTNALATSQLFFVFQGSGRTQACGRTIEWKQGDFMVSPLTAKPSITPKAKQASTGSTMLPFFAISA